MVNLNQEIWKRFRCIYGVEAGPGALALLRRLQREQFLSTNSKWSRPHGAWLECPRKISHAAFLFLAVPESLNKCFAILPFYISTPSQRNRREQVRAPGKYGRKVFKMASTSVWCFHTQSCPSPHCWPLPEPLSLAHSSTCNFDPTNGSGDTSSNLKRGVTFTTSF